MGAAGGAQHARDFVAQAQALGFRSGTLWMVAEDPTQAGTGAWPQIDAYLRAAYPIIHLHGFILGAYGSEAYLDHALAAGVIDRRWYVGGWASHESPDLTQQSNSPGRSTLGGSVDCNWAPSVNWGYLTTTPGGLEVLDPNDPVVQNIQAKLDFLESVVGNHTGKDDAGKDIMLDYVAGYTLSAARAARDAAQQLVSRGSAPGGGLSDADIQRVADTLLSQIKSLKLQ